MRACLAYYKRYMSLMTAARGCRDMTMRRSLYNEARLYLDAWFDAVEDELERNPRWAR